MENRYNNENIDVVQEKVQELFKELVSERLYEKWADTFEIESFDEKTVNIIYHGTESVGNFKKECKMTVSSCIYSILGDGRKIKITGKKIRNRLSSEVKKNIKAVKFFAIGLMFVCIAAAVLIVMCNYIGNRTFRETFYSTSSIKADSRVRVVHLSDLHGSSYGKDNIKLKTRVAALKPDIIICTGDMTDSPSDDVESIVSLGEAFSSIAPSYYIYGNNEVEGVFGFTLNEKNLDEKFGFNESSRDESALLNMEDAFESRLEESGFRVLKNEIDTIRVKTMNVDIYGVLTSNPSSFWSYSGNAFNSYINENKDNLKITAVHEPFIFEEFQPEFWGDLMICGHTHGGVIRIPLFGPFYTHEGGILPERNGDFVYGRYDTAGSPLIVSSGLENSNVLRINNQPELVVIDINKF